MLFSKRSLYLPLVITIVVTVVVIISLESVLAYDAIKKHLVADVHNKSKSSLIMLKANMAGFVESYAVNEYDKLIFNGMGDRDYQAIIVKDYNMGQVTGGGVYISGKIRDLQWNVVDYDAENRQHAKLIESAYYSDKISIRNAEGHLIATVHIYVSDRFIQQKLNEVIKLSSFNAIFLIFVLVASLFFSIRYFTLKPLESIAKSIEQTDHEGIPINAVVLSGTKEIRALASAMNTMIQSIKESREKLRRAQKMDAVGQLAGGIAHDYNNILGIIIGNLDFLKHDAGSDEKSLQRINSANKAAQRAAKLTRQLLDFSCNQAVDEVNCDINKVILDMGSLIAHSVTPAVEVENNFSDNLWLTRLNIGDFQDAILNLLLNARDAMPNGGQLIIETQNCQLDSAYCKNYPNIDPGDYVQLTVSDTGKGIPKGALDAIFEPFYSTKPEGEGTGLGLAMVFGFINRTHGHIKVYSEPGIGSTFRLYLPRAEGEEYVGNLVEQYPEQLPKGTETILAVDDETLLLSLAKESLEGLGYQVITAHNGKQALEQFKKYPDISMLFSDVVMPGGINGYELAEQMVSVRPNLRVLLTSGYTNKTIAYNGQARFNANLLSKPYTQLALAQRIRSVLDEALLKNNVGRVLLHPWARVEWREEFSLGIVPIDDDHKRLIRIINRAYTLAENGASHGALADILSELLVYTREHFRREERLMEICGYPGLANHCQVHQLLTKQVKDKHRDFERGCLSIQELVAFLTNWLIDHIQGMDQAIVPYCKGKEREIIKKLRLSESGSETS